MKKSIKSEIEKMDMDEKTDLIVDLLSSGALGGCLENYAAVLAALRMVAVGDALYLAYDGVNDGAKILKNLANAIGRAEQFKP